MWFRNWLIALFLVVTTALGFCVFAPTQIAFQAAIAGLLAICFSILAGALFVP